MQLDGANTEFGHPVHFGAGVGNGSGQHSTECDQAVRRRFAILRDPIVRFGSKPDNFRGNVIDEAGALDAKTVEQAEKFFRVCTIPFDIGVVLASVLHQFERGWLHHVIRHDVDVDVYDGLQKSRPSTEFRRSLLRSIEANVFKVQRLIIHPARRGSNPIRKLTELDDTAAHERLDEGMVLGSRQPLGFTLLPGFLAQDFSFGADKVSREIADFAMEALVRQGQTEGDAGIVNDALPAGHAIGDLFDVIIAQAFVQSGQRRDGLGKDFSVDDFEHGVFRLAQNVIVIQFSFTEASFQAAGEIIRSVRRNVRTVKIESHAVVKIQVLLNRLEINHAQGAHIRGAIELMFLHHFAGALNDAADAGLADEHVVGFLGEHEAAGARKRIKAGFGERAKLEFAVAIGEEREHIESEPVGSRFVERTENAGIVGVAGAAREEGFGFLAAVASEIAMQQIHHSPQVTAFFDVHLKNISQVVHRRTRRTQHSLLFDGSRLGVSLGDNDAAQRGAVFARDFLPRGLAFVGAEIHFTLFIAWLEKNSPAVVRHLDVAELRPAVRFHACGGPQIDFVVVALIRTHVVPPAHVSGLPMLERALQYAVASQINVVRNLFGVIDHSNLLAGIGAESARLFKLFPSRI